MTPTLGGGVRLREEREGLRLLGRLLGDGEREASEDVRDLSRSPRLVLLGPLSLPYCRGTGDGERAGVCRRRRDGGEASSLYLRRRDGCGEMDLDREMDGDRCRLLSSIARSGRPPGT